MVNGWLKDDADFVGWAERSVPTIEPVTEWMVGTLRFAHPTNYR